MARKGGAGGVIIVAIALGVVTAFLIYRYFDQINKSNRQNWQKVIVARQDIPARTKVTREMLVHKEVPPDSVAEGLIAKMEDAENRMARRELRTGDQIRASDLVTEAAMPSLAYKVPEGMRAIAIGASELIAVGASVQPGDHVDILANFQDPVTKEEKTKMLMQNVLVLAVNRGQTEPGAKEGGASSSMTLAVKPEDTEYVLAMERAGALRVSLRPVNDKQTFSTPGVVVRDLTASVTPQIIITTKTANVEKIVPIVINPPPKQRSETKIWRGTAEQTIAND
jgi:pilus assembly protein CpaB